MQTILFAVFDTKTKTYCRPFAAVNNQVAIRDFAYAANDKTTEIGRYGLDYFLFRIGTYDDETAVLTNETPSNLGMAANFVYLNEGEENV